MTVVVAVSLPKAAGPAADKVAEMLPLLQGPLPAEPLLRTVGNRAEYFAQKRGPHLGQRVPFHL